MRMKKGYRRALYDGVGWAEEVKTYSFATMPIKLLMNPGQDRFLPDSADDVNPIVMNGISTVPLIRLLLSSRKWLSSGSRSP